MLRDVGYSTVWLAEHHVTDWNVITDPLTVLAYLADATRRIRLGTAVVNLGVHHPVAIAERAALVDALSGGRLDLGIGKGFARSDYARFGCATDDVTEKFSDHHDDLLAQLQREAVLGEIPVWLSTTGNASTLQLARKHGHGLLLASPAGKLRNISDSVHRWPVPSRLAVVRAVHIADDETQARAEIRPYARWYVDRLAALQPEVEAPPLDGVLDDFFVLGGAPDCRERLQQLNTELGLHEILVVPGIGGMPATQALDQIARLADW